MKGFDTQVFALEAIENELVKALNVLGANTSYISDIKRYSKRY